MTFSADVSRIMAKARTRMEAVARGSVVALATDVIVPSPVDTGRFRANWRAGLDEIDGTTDNEVDKTGGVSIERAKAVAAQMKIGDVAYVTNSLHYAEKLEYGWSRQAPFGMVRVTVARAPVIIADVIRSTP